MKYNKLNELQNSYPTNQLTVSGSYSTKDEKIKYTGKYPGNFLTFETLKVDDKSLGEIQVSPNVNFRFIVMFRDGNNDINDDLWTSQGFLDDLRDANNKSNPYFDRTKVTMAVVDYQVLKDYWLSDKFTGQIGTKDIDGFGERYAEVRITETLDTKEEMLKHIDWMVSSKEELREVETFGAWDVVTTESLGFSDEFLTSFTLADLYGNTGQVPDGRGDTLRDGFPINLDDRTPSTDRNGNPVRVVTGSLVPDGRGEGRDGEPIDLDSRTSTGDRTGTTVTTVTTDGTSTRSGTTTTRDGGTIDTSTRTFSGLMDYIRRIRG